jgi:uncharacterized protein with PIN domain
LSFRGEGLESEIGFVADSMHGKLARWLRILGYDTVYWRGDDEDLLDFASNSGRILLTSDVELHRAALKRNVRSVLLPLEGIEVQLAMVAAYVRDLMGIDPERFLSPEATRCSHCNGELVQIGDDLWECGSCKQRYWEGSHWRRIEKTLRKALEIALTKGSADAGSGCGEGNLPADRVEGRGR